MLLVLIKLLCLKVKATPKFVFLTLHVLVESDCWCKENLVISFQLVKFRRAVNIEVPPTLTNKQTSIATKKASETSHLWMTLRTNVDECVERKG